MAALDLAPPARDYVIYNNPLCVIREAQLATIWSLAAEIVLREQKRPALQAGLFTDG